MPVLENTRQERFAQELARGRTATEAYRQAGYAAKDASCWRAASKLRREIDVAARVRELQEAGAERAILTEEWVISRLMKNAERAMQEQAVINAEGEESGEFRYDGTVANRALELLGKKLGIFSDTVNLNAKFEGVDDGSLDARIHAAAIAAGVAANSETEH